MPASPNPLSDDGHQTPQRTPRGKRVWVRFSDDEHADLIARAKASGLSASSLIRDHLGKVEIRHRADERQRTAMLNHINAT